MDALRTVRPVKQDRAPHCITPGSLSGQPVQLSNSAMQDEFCHTMLPTDKVILTLCHGSSLINCCNVCTMSVIPRSYGQKLPQTA